MKPPSPKIDPRTGMDIASALHIDHDPPVPNAGHMLNSTGMVDPSGIGINQAAQNTFMPPDMEQTPSDYSYGTNHSDAGYMSTPGSGSIHGNSMVGGQFNNNNSHFNQQFHGGAGMGRGGYGNRNQMGFGKGPGFGNTPNAGSFYGNTPGSSSFSGSTPSNFTNTPMSFDSGVPPTPGTPQTPQPPMKNDFNINDNRNRGRNFPNRERRDSYNNRDNRERRDSYNNRDRNNKDNDWNRHRNNDWGRDRYGRGDRDRNRRDMRNDRDSWNRDRDNKNNRYRDRERDRNRNDRNDFRNIRDNDVTIPRNKPNDLAPVYPPPPPPEEEIHAPTPIFTPPAPKPQPPPLVIPPPQVPPPQPQLTPEAKEEEETRSMSLDSRIQSLLSGLKSPEPARPKTPPAIKPTLPCQSPHLYDSSSQALVGNIPVPQDDDDRMSLDSTGSAGEPGSIEVNQTNTAIPPPLIPPSDLQNNFMPPGYMNNFPPGGQFNQNFVNQMNNEINDQKLVQDPKEEADKHEITFTDVLENFVKELKEIMKKDLCKKMVETSAFKTYEAWWDREEEKTKVDELSLTLKMEFRCVCDCRYY